MPLWETCPLDENDCTADAKTKRPYEPTMDEWLIALEEAGYILQPYEGVILVHGSFNH